MSEQCGFLRAASRSIAPTAELVSTVAQIRTRAGVSGFAEEAMSYMYGDGPGDNVVRFNVPRSDFRSPRCRRRRGGQSATASTFWQVEMSASKATVRLLAAGSFRWASCFILKMFDRKPVLIPHQRLLRPGFVR